MKVLIVENNEALRDRLVELLCEDGVISIVAVATGFADALRSAQRVQPDVVVTAFAFPDGSAVELAGALCATRPELQVWVLDDRPDADRRERSLAAGAARHGERLALLEDLRADLRQSAALRDALASPPILLPADEPQRLAQLHGYEILDSEPEEEFDDIARLAASICATPMAMISLIDADRQWFKATVGLALRETSRNVSFCQHALLNHATLVIPDARNDVRFASNPLVTAAPHIRSYAGALLRSREGHALGTLCVADRQARQFTQPQIEGLEILADQAMARIELRWRMRRMARDLDDYLRVARAFERESKFHRMLIDSIDGIVWECDADTLACSYVSAGVSRLLDGRPEDWLHDASAWQTAIAESDRGRVLAVFHGVREDAVERPADFAMLRKDGVPVWLRGRVQLLNGGDEAIKLRALMVDVSETQRARAHIDRLVTQDEVTGLPNRRLLLERLSAAIRSDSRNAKRLAVLLIEISNLKLIHDTLGHSKVDQVLVEVATRLQESVDAQDLIARTSAESFALAVAANDAGQAALLARRVLQSLALPFGVDGNHVHLRPAIGISMFPDDAVEADLLLGHADTAAKYAREAGANRHRLFTPEMSTRALELLSLENDLRLALEGGGEQFLLHYQPVLNVQTGGLISVEALVRWQHPTLGLLMPSAFIPMAEETGLIQRLGKRVLDRACQQLQTWLADGWAPPRVAVNCSAGQFRNGLLMVVARALERHRVPPRMLELELTESVLLRDLAAVRRILEPLGRLGIEVAVDDFGTGYSSLSVLKELPIHTLKIDSSFVANLHSDVSTQIIVKAIIAMAHGLGLAVTAEGVENEVQLAQLAVLGCDHYQGYLGSSPLTPEELVARHGIRRTSANAHHVPQAEADR